MRRIPGSRSVIPLFSALIILLLCFAQAHAGTNYSGDWMDERGFIITIQKTGSEVEGTVKKFPEDFQDKVSFEVGDAVFRGSVMDEDYYLEETLRAFHEIDNVAPSPPVIISLDNDDVGTPHDWVDNSPVDIEELFSNSDSTWLDIEGAQLLVTQCTSYRGNYVKPGGGKGEFKLNFLGPSVKTDDCPAFLMDVVADDFTIILNDISGKCISAVTTPEGMQGSYDPRNPGLNTEDTSYDRLEDFLKSRPDLLGHDSTKPNIGSACFRKTREERSERYIKDGSRKGKYDICRDERFLNALTTEYYSSNRRLMDGILSSFANLAVLDKIKDMDCRRDQIRKERLGLSSAKRLLDGIACNDYQNYPSLKEACDRLQSSCTESVSYRDVIEQTETAMRQREPLLKAVRDSKNEISALVVKERHYHRFLSRADAKRAIAADKRKIAKLKVKVRLAEDLMRVVESTSAWLIKEEFEETYSDSLEACNDSSGTTTEHCDLRRDEFICAGIKAEALKIREPALERLNVYKAALNCLNGHTAPDKCNNDTYREAVNKAPSFPVINNKKIPHNKAAKNTVMKELAVLECRYDQRVADDEIRRIELDFLEGVALTIATAGLGEVVAIARAAAVARGSVALSRTARALQFLMPALDLADMGRGIADELRQCGNVFNQLDDIGSVPPGGPQCPSGSGDSSVQIVQDYYDCAIAGVATQAVLGGLPLVPDAVRHVIDKRALRNARKAIGRGLSEPFNAYERQVMLDVLSRLKQSGDLTAEQLAKIKADLMSILSDAGKVDELIARIRPDYRKIGDELVHGLKGRTGKTASYKLSNGEVHHISVQHLDDGVKLMVCSKNCGDILDKIEDALLLTVNKGPGKQKRARLEALRDQVTKLQQDLASGNLSKEAFNSRLKQIKNAMSELPELPSRRGLLNRAQKRINENLIDEVSNAAKDAEEAFNNAKGSGFDKEQFELLYRGGFKFNGKRWVNAVEVRGGRKAFSSNIETPMQALDELMEGENFERYARLLSDEFKTTREELAEIIGMPAAGASHSSARKRIRDSFKDKIFERLENLTDDDVSSEIYKKVLESTGSRKAAKKASMYDKFLSMTDRLGGNDKGALAENFYAKHFASTKNIPEQVEVKGLVNTLDEKRLLGTLTEKEKRLLKALNSDKLDDEFLLHHMTQIRDRRLDILDDWEIIEIKHIVGELGKRGKAQFGEHADAMLGTTIKANGEATEISGLMWSFTNPKGARANVDFMVEKLKNYRGQDVRFELFDRQGRRMHFSTEDFNDLLGDAGDMLANEEASKALRRSIIDFLDGK